MDCTQSDEPGSSLRLSIGRACQDVFGVLAVVGLPLMCGCSPAKFTSPERLNRGYTIVLPGIEGTSYLNASIARGLVDGGWPGAVEVYDWTVGSVLLFPVTLRAESRNRHEAEHLARKIMTYQDRYPDRPVHIIGHSGGGGVAVFTLEALPPERQITSALLLAPALAPDHDLRKALRRTEHGIMNFYSHYDVGFLKAGTTVMGTIDGRHTSAAGAVGFQMPWGLDDEDRRLYSSRLRQQPYSRKMADCGHSGGHVGWSNRQFVATWLCPILVAQDGDQPALASGTERPHDEAGSRSSGNSPTPRARQ